MTGLLWVRLWNRGFIKAGIYFNNLSTIIFSRRTLSMDLVNVSVPRSCRLFREIWWPLWVLGYCWCSAEYSTWNATQLQQYSIYKLWWHHYKTNEFLFTRACYEELIEQLDSTSWRKWSTSRNKNLLDFSVFRATLRSVSGWNWQILSLIFILLVNTPWYYLHTFCATWMSSDLATRVTLIRVSRWRLGEYITQG
jgi:hypothetical protein